MQKNYIQSLLGDNERILYGTRQHWFVLISSIFLELFLILIIAVLAVAASFFFPLLYGTILIVVPFALLIIPFLGGLRDTLIWWNKQYIVTNRRVIQVSGVFNKNVIDSSLEKVNDVKMEQSALGRMFNFGDIEILTASEMGANLFQRIGDPIRFKTAMLNAKEQLERYEGSLDLDDVPLMLERLDVLRRQGTLTEQEFQDKKAKLLAKL